MDNGAAAAAADYDLMVANVQLLLDSTSTPLNRVAKSIGMPQSTLHRYIKGDPSRRSEDRRRNMRTPEFSAIAHHFGFKTADLLRADLRDKIAKAAA